MALWMSRLKMPACSPNFESLTSARAASKSEKRDRMATGPNASSSRILRPRPTPSSRVASSMAPVRLPPHSKVAPAARASLIQSSSRVASFSSIIGPMKVVSSRGSPQIRARAFFTSRSRIGP